MSKPSSSNSGVKLATLLLPIVAVFVAGLLVVLQWNRLRVLQEQRAKTQHDLVFLDQLSRDLQNKPAVGKVAVVAQAPNEQSLFLDMIRGFADKSHVHIVRYANRPTLMPANNADAKKDGSLPGVQTLTSDVEITGTYNEVRQFLYQLLHSPRLYNTTDLKWSRGNALEKWPATHLAFTLLRYVEAPAVPAPKPGSGAVGSLPANG